ncbi:hypothetical protein BDW22DRAFT_1351682, partial [Trametopsis cervina]
MMSISFPAGESIYYTRDLNELSRIRPGLPPLTTRNLRRWAKGIKRLTLKECTEDGETAERMYAVIEANANWPLDDTDEEELEESK